MSNWRRKSKGLLIHGGSNIPQRICQGWIEEDYSSFCGERTQRKVQGFDLESETTQRGLRGKANFIWSFGIEV